MAQRFNSSKERDAMSYAVSWPVMLDGSELEITDGNCTPEELVAELDWLEKNGQIEWAEHIEF